MDLRLGPSLKFEILSQGAEKATSRVGPLLKPGWGLQVCAPLLGMAGEVPCWHPGLPEARVFLSLGKT